MFNLRGRVHTILGSFCSRQRRQSRANTVCFGRRDRDAEATCEGPETHRRAGDLDARTSWSLRVRRGLSAVFFKGLDSTSYGQWDRFFTLSIVFGQGH